MSRPARLPLNPRLPLNVGWTVALAVVLAGCASTVAGQPAAGAAVASAEQQAAAAAGAASDVDVCSLLTDAEITKVIGAHSAPQRTTGECFWENTDTGQSVTVDIGARGSAPGGVLPPPLPGASSADGPDGIRFTSGNTADFVVGDRECHVQVAVHVSDNSDRPTEARLAGLIRSRMH